MSADYSTMSSIRETARPERATGPDRNAARMKGMGRALFVAILFLMVGTLNIIYGIAAVSNAHFFDNTQYVFSSLHTWGWITIIVGIIQLTGSSAVLREASDERVIGIVAASIGALESLLFRHTGSTY